MVIKEIFATSPSRPFRRHGRKPNEGEKMDLIIREAEEMDLESIISIFKQPEMDNGEVISLEKAKDIFKKTKKYPFFKVYVAVLENKVVGTFELLIMDNLAHQGVPSGIIEDVAVSEDYQGKGIGKEMMRFAMKVCKDFGCYKVTLSSNLKRENAHKQSTGT